MITDILESILLHNTNNCFLQTREEQWELSASPVKLTSLKGYILRLDYREIYTIFDSLFNLSVNLLVYLVAKVLLWKKNIERNKLSFHVQC